MVDLKDLPPLTQEDLAAIEEQIKDGEGIVRRGRAWFERLSDTLQKYPDQTLVSINVETGEFFTTESAYNDLETLSAKRPRGDKSRYWTCRLMEGRDGKKYAGGVYSAAHA